MLKDGRHSRARLPPDTKNEIAHAYLHAPPSNFTACSGEHPRIVCNCAPPRAARRTKTRQHFRPVAAPHKIAACFPTRSCAAAATTALCSCAYRASNARNPPRIGEVEKIDVGARPAQRLARCSPPRTRTSLKLRKPVRTTRAQLLRPIWKDLGEKTVRGSVEGWCARRLRPYEKTHKVRFSCLHSR